MAAAFTFSEALHQYTRSDGLVVPSATQVLRRTGWISFEDVQKDVLERASQRGTAVHAITEFLDTEFAGVPEEELDLAPVDPEYLPYVQAWLKFKRECDVKILDVEQQSIVTLNGMPYGMKYDRLASVNGREAILEIKTSAQKAEWWGCQTAAYDSGLPQCPNQLHRDRYAVQLKSDGQYRLWPFTDEQDYQAWTWMLALAWYMKKKGYEF